MTFQLGWIDHVTLHSRIAFYAKDTCNPENVVTSEVSFLSEWKPSLHFPEVLLIYMHLFIQSLSECDMREDMLQG